MGSIERIDTPATEVIHGGSREEIVMEGEKGGMFIRAGGMLLNQGSHLLAGIDSHLAFIDSAPGRLIVAGLAARTMRNTYFRIKFDPLDALEQEEELEELREIEEADRESLAEHI